MSRIKDSKIEYSIHFAEKEKGEWEPSGNMKRRKLFHVSAMRFEDTGERIVDGARSWSM